MLAPLVLKNPVFFFSLEFAPTRALATHEDFVSSLLNSTYKQVIEKVAKHSRWHNLCEIRISITRETT